MPTKKKTEKKDACELCGGAGEILLVSDRYWTPKEVGWKDAGRTITEIIEDCPKCGDEASG